MMVSWRPSRDLKPIVESEGAVILGQVTGQRVVVFAGPRAAELLAQLLGGCHMRRIGDGRVAGPHAGVSGHDTPAAFHPRTVGTGGSCRLPPDRAQGDRVGG